LIVIRRISLILAICGVAIAQDSSQKQQDSSKQQNPPQNSNQPAPLFGGKLGTKSSQKTKESATLGFNGIDPSGKVDAQMLATSATSDSEAKVKKMSDSAPSPADLDGFIKEGGLNKK
jgi:hypothetical protein